MTFSVLICTYNRHTLLRRALDALIERSEERPDQVVVVNGGDERADRVVEAYVGRRDVEVTLIKTVNKNLAASRNVGLPHCHGAIVAMTDDDAEVFPDWVTRMKRAHQEHPEAGAVGGAVLGTNADTLAGKIADQITFPAWTAPRYVRTLPGVNIAYKQDVIRRVGAQDELLFRGEDVDCNWRVQKLGYKIYFDPGIKVYHHHRPTFQGLFHQQYMYGRAYYLVRRKWLDMYCVYPHGFRRPKDILKAVNVIAALFYQPLLSARLLSRWTDRLAALPFLFVSGVAWKSGMVVQGLRSKVYETEARDADRQTV